MSDELVRVAKFLSDLEEVPLLSLVQELLDTGVEPTVIIAACQDGMQVVGERYSAEDYFVSEVLFSSELFNKVIDVIGPRLLSSDSGPKTMVVIGTVKDDVHDIGKNLVAAMLRCNGFEVYDLGIDVPARAFVDKVRETGARVVGLSGLLTVAFDSMKDTVNALEIAGLRDKVKIMIGGDMVNDAVCDMVGADGCGRDAVAAVKLAKSFSEAQAQ